MSIDRALTSERTHTQAGALSAAEMDRRHRAALDETPTVARCNLAGCGWAHVGTAGECRDLSLAHRAVAHPPTGRRPVEWTRERAVEAARTFRARRGRWPARRDKATCLYLPSPTTVDKLFGSWITYVATADPDRPSGDVTVRTPGRHSKWTQQTALVAIRRFAIREGRPPTALESSAKGSGLPAAKTASSLFGSFSEMIVAAGFDRPKPGGHRPPLRQDTVADALAKEVADVL